MRCVVTHPFFVKRGGHIYAVGETFEGPEATVKWLVRHGLAEPCERSSTSPAADVATSADPSQLTVAELKSLCDERGIAYAKKATKAQLVSLLGE